MSFNLIVPVAADKLEYKEKMPNVFSLNSDGVMFCVNSILGLNLEVFDSIYFTILNSQNQKYCLKELFQIQFKRLGIKNAFVVILEDSTKSEPETVYKTIVKENIEGAIFIKDADSFFSGTVCRENGVAVYPLEEMHNVNPQNKSYVTVDDMYYVTNIIEKRIVSHLFSAGGYCFENVNDFCSYFNLLEKEDGLYLSHLIYSMLLDKNIFRPMLVDNYIDYDNETK